MKPVVTPTMCGRLARRPKFAPDAMSIVLLGPGVIEAAKANRQRAVNSSGV